MDGAAKTSADVIGASGKSGADQGALFELRQNWAILAGATIAMFSGATSLPYATSGIFVTALQEQFGWTRFSISLGPAIIMLGIALTSPVIGMLAERIDPRRLIIPGMLVVATCFGFLSLISGDIRPYYAACLVIAFVGNLSGATALTAIVTRYFDRSRGAALGIAMAGAGLTTGIGGPAVMLLITSHGWRSGYVALSLFCFAMAPIVWLLLRRAPMVLGAALRTERTGATFREAMASPTYWLLTLAFFLVSVGSTGLFVHFVPLLIDRGISPRGAAAFSSIIGISIIASRLITGFIVDKIAPSLVAAVIMFLGTAGYAAFLLGSPWSAVFGAFAVGVSFGAETDLVGFMVARFFGLRNFGRIFGLMYGICLSGLVISPLMYGFVRDMWGNYDPMLVVALTLLSISALIFLIIPSRKASSNLPMDNA